MKYHHLFSYTIAALAIVLLAGCNHQDAHDHDHGHEAQHSQVQLKNGQKWEANAETTAGIHQMQQIVTAGLNPPDVQTEQLSSDLRAEFSGIIEKCTMKGEAHDQLHNYLLPLKDQLTELAACQEDRCMQILESISVHLNEYHDNFE